MTRTIGALVACAVLAADGRAEEILRELTFERTVVPDAPGPRVVSLLTLERPGITQARYAVLGEVRYEGVEGRGYLEMWSEIPGKGSFFSRTLDTGGAMGAIAGTSGWRAFALPFDATGAPPPSALQINVVLPGRGSVELRAARLVQYAASEDASRAPGAWWGVRTAALGGGILGSLIGCLGAAIGILAPRGRARGFAFGFLKGLLALGVVCLAFGIAALLRAQPYEVYYPLLLIGGMGVVLSLSLQPILRRRYEELELRKMSAQDVGLRTP
jgi:hypothetical protein